MCVVRAGFHVPWETDYVVDLSQGVILKVNHKVRYKASFFLPLLVLFPAYQSGIRLIYIFEVVLAIFFLNSLLKKKYVISQEVFNAALIILIGLVITAWLQTFVYGHVLSLSLLRFSVLFLMVFYWSKTFITNKSEIQNGVILAIILATLLAYAQVIDQRIFSGAFFVSDIVAKFYPYNGELSERNLNITGGLQLKTNSVFSPTSIVDGQAILAGNFFAISSVIMLFWRRPLLFVASALLTVLIFSRGSWLMLCVGVSYWVLTVEWKISLRELIKYLSGVLLAVGLIRYSIFWDYLGGRIANTLFVFGISDQEVGSSIDPRTDIVWPRFISAMNDIGLHSWIIGADLSLPTDSGFLFIFRESGIFGLLIVCTLFWYGYILSGKDRLVLALILMVAAGSMVNPVIQGHRLLYLFSLIVLVQSMAHRSQSALGMLCLNHSINQPHSKTKR